MKRTNLLWVALAAAFLIPTIYADTAAAQLTSYTVGVDGMACPFCTFGVEKKIGEIKGVKAVKVDIKTAQVDVQLDANSSVSPDQLMEAVDEAGFEIRKIVVRGTGEINGEGSQAKVDFSGFKVVLLGFKQAAGKYALTGELKRGMDGTWTLSVTKATPAV